MKKPQKKTRKKMTRRRAPLSPHLEKALDLALSRVSPSLRQQIDQLKDRLEQQQFDFNDIRFLAVKILDKAKTVRSALGAKPSPRKKKAARKKR